MLEHMERARKHFHQMPDQVFELWLSEIIYERGWPFATAKDETKGTTFGALFGHHSLAYWTQLNWSLTTVSFGEVVLDPLAEEKAEGLIREVFLGERAFVTPLENMHERFRACADFIGANKCFPKPVVCHTYPDSTWGLLDGHHRLAALMFHEDIEEFPFWAWLGRHPMLAMVQKARGSHNYP